MPISIAIYASALAAASLQSVPVATKEADDLGIRLARTTGLAAIAPALIEKDLSELAGEDVTLTKNERDRLLAIGRERGRQGLEQVITAIGKAYSRRLSISDLQVLVAAAETPAAQRWRNAEPMVIADAAAALGSIDLKGRVAARFCKETKKLCKR